MNEGKPSIIQLRRVERKQASFTLMLFLLTGIYWAWRKEPYGEDSTVVEYIVPDSPAEKGNLLPGDRSSALMGECHNEKEISALLQRKRSTAYRNRFGTAGR